MARRFLAALLLFSLVFAAIPLSLIIEPVGADASYVVRTSAVAIESTQAPSQRKLAVTSDGHLHVVYHRQGSSDILQIYHAESSDGGMTWAEEPVTSAGRDQNYPSLAVDSNDVLHVAWQDGKGGEPGVIPYTYYRRKTTSWQAAELVASYAALPSIAVDSNNDVHLVYMPYKYAPGYWGGGNGIRYRERTAIGWQAEESVSSEIMWVSYPAIAIDGYDNVHVAWNDAPRALYYDLHYRERTASGWGTEVQINTENDNRGGTVPSLAIDSGNNVHVIWWYPKDSGQWSIRHRQYNGSWQAVEDIEGPTTYALSFPVAAFDRQDHLHVVWSGQHSGSTTYSQIRHREYDGAWQPVQNLTASTSDNQTTASLMWANYPEIGGVRSNVLQNGFSFIWMDGTTIKYYTSGTGGSPSGKIVFSSERAGNWEIYAMDPDGTNLVRLTDNPATDDFPAVSPDGSQIAFTSDRDGNGEIYVMNADGSGQTRLTYEPRYDACAEWSPDGTRIIFASQRAGEYDIYVMDAADGGNLTRLTSYTGSDDCHPSWSPDGATIAFTSNRPSIHNPYDVYTMNADGTNQTNITNYPGQDDMQPDWSPDGSRIVFTTRRDAGDEEIYTMDPDGSALARLTNVAGYDLDPKWSPDGSKIVFTSVRDGNHEIYVMNADGTGQTNITNNPYWDRMPCWAPRLVVGPNTPVGSPVTVPLNGVTVTFDNVTVAGDTSATTSPNNHSGPIPGGFKLRGLFVDITTTATYTGQITVGISYASTPQPENLKLFHWEDGHWQDVTTWVDVDNQIIYGEVTSFSEFFVGSPYDSRCFIATAAYGSPMAEELDTFRAFRDRYLKTNPVGSALVSLYYRCSPPVAGFIDDHPTLKPAARVVLTPPLIMARFATESTMAEKAAAACCIAIIGILSAVIARRMGSRAVLRQ